MHKSGYAESSDSDQREQLKTLHRTDSAGLHGLSPFLIASLWSDDTSLVYKNKSRSFSTQYGYDTKGQRLRKKTVLWRGVAGYVPGQASAEKYLPGSDCDGRRSLQVEVDGSAT